MISRSPTNMTCLCSSLQVAEYEGKKFQNVAKDGLVIGSNADKAKQRHEALEAKFKPLSTFMEKTALKDRIEKVVVSQRLHNSPCALVANQWGWLVINYHATMFVCL